MNVNIFCPIFFCCLEHDNSKSPSDFIVIHRIKVNMTFPRPCLNRRRSAQTARPRPPGCALRSRKTNKMSVFAENRGDGNLHIGGNWPGLAPRRTELFKFPGNVTNCCCRPRTCSSPRQQFSENWKSQKFDRVGRTGIFEFWTSIRDVSGISKRFLL